MTLAANPPIHHTAHRLLPDLVRLLREHLPRLRSVRAAAEAVSPPEAVVRALCHDMRTPLACLDALLSSLGSTPAGRTEALELARAQTAHLASMLRTADAVGGCPPRAGGTRRLGDVIRASVAASGLPARQLTVDLADGAAEVGVGDARVQRILLNLLENAHRHGGGAPVQLSVTRRPGWVALALSQAVGRPERVVGHLRTTTPPPDLTGLGLWSVQRQTGELGGRLEWVAEGDTLTLTVHLPDR